jgi:NIMA (never in mitosis gene a)-related kinase
VVQYLGSFTHGSKHYLAMEYCDHGDLGDYIKRAWLGVGALDIPEWKIWRFLLQLLLGLEHLHERRIVHCDLKPQNVFLQGRENAAKMGDFGASQLLAKNYSFVHECVGTLFYVSPEVCRGDAFTTKTDVWALGCILYELCTSRKPFEGLSDENLKYKIINSPHPLLPEERHELGHVYNACMIKDPQMRPSAAQILCMPQVQKWAN